MQIYKTRDFAKWAKKARVTDESLLKVVLEMNKDLLGDRLGSYIFKKRLGIEGRGKRGGARTIVVFKKDDVAFFLYGYLKNELSNISKDEQESLRVFGKALLKLSYSEICENLKKGALVKVSYE